MSVYPARKGRLVEDSGTKSWMVYEPESDSLHELNETARAIWELCDGRTDPAEMARAVSEVTGMELEDSQSVVTDTVENLASRDLVAYED